MTNNIWCFVSMRWGDGDVGSVALTQDGHCIATHLSSNVSYARYDMGITSERKHDAYKEHYPDGFQVHWVDDIESTDNPQAFRDALDAYDVNYPKEKDAQS